MSTRLKNLSFMLAMLLFIMGFGAGAPSWASAPKAFILVFGYGVSVDRLLSSENPRIRTVLNNGAVGLMNTTTANLRNLSDSYASVSMGTRAIGSKDAGLAFNMREEYEGRKVSALVRDMGLPNADDNSAVHIGIRKLTKTNMDFPKGYGAIPGSLGEALSHGGIGTGVFGNADKGGSYHREAALAACDMKGFVRFGRLEPASFSDTADSLYEWLARRESGLKGKYAVVELGRSPAKVLDRLALIVRKSEELRASGVNTQLMFVSPGASKPDLEKGETLTPVFLYGDGVSRGILGSPSTRKLGLVTNCDVAPTVLNYFKAVVPETMVGLPILVGLPKSLEKTSITEWIMHQNTLWTSRTRLRDVFVPVFVGFLIIMFFLIVILTYIKTKGFGFPVSLRTEAGVMIVMWWPLAFMLAGLSPSVDVAGYIRDLVISLAPAVVVSALFRKKPVVGLTVICALCTGLVIIDQLAHGPLAARSILSYDIQTGARFYGLGNEYMGLIIGASITLLASLKERDVIALSDSAILSLALVLIIGLPFFGANAVGAVIAVIGLGAMLILISGRKLTYYFAMILMGASLGFIAALSYIDRSLGKGASTHLSRAVLRVEETGPLEAIRIMVRKLLMNLSLIAYTPWTLAFLLVLVGLIYLTYRPTKLWKRLTDKHPWLMKGLQASLFGSVAALLFEDSGIVAGSLAMIFPFFGLAYVLISEVSFGKNSGT